MNLLIKIWRKMLFYISKINLYKKKISGYPAQTTKEIKIYKKIFDKFSNTKDLKVFEWGCGFSTLFYATYLTKKNATFHWHAIDNNETWYNNMTAKLKKSGLSDNVTLYLKAFLPFWMKPGWTGLAPEPGKFSPKEKNELEYITFPEDMKEKFDIIFVDARFRNRCIKVASKLLNKNGILVLHDAQKSQYHGNLDKFQIGKFYNTGSWHPFQKVKNQVWIGSQDNKDIFETLKEF